MKKPRSHQPLHTDAHCKEEESEERLNKKVVHKARHSRRARKEEMARRTRRESCCSHSPCLLPPCSQSVGGVLPYHIVPNDIL